MAKVAVDDPGDLRITRRIAHLAVRRRTPYAGSVAVDNGGHKRHRYPGAAMDTIVNARTSPSIATSNLVNSVADHRAQALRRSKNRAPHAVHFLATRCGRYPSTKYSTDGIGSATDSSSRNC